MTVHTPPPTDTQRTTFVDVPVRESGATTFTATVVDVPLQPPSLVEAVLKPGVGGHPIARRFVLEFVLVLALILGVVASFNWMVDPLDTFGRGPQQGPGTDRNVKVHLFRGEKLPQILLLGSSRMQKYDPSVIRKLTGLRAFNASVAGSNIIDQTAFAGWAAERAANGDGPMPKIVYGIAPEEFRPQPTGLALRAYPELARQVHGGSRFFDNLETKWAPLIQWGTIKTSVSVIAGTVKGNDFTDKKAPEFRDDGFLMRGQEDSALKDGRTRQSRWDRVQRQHVRFYERRPQRDLPYSARARFESLLAIANKAGDTPTIFVLPMSSALSSTVDPLGRSDMSDRLRTYLTQLQKRYKFQWLDYSDVSSFGGDNTKWYDGAHPMAENASAVLRQLLNDGGLAVSGRVANPPTSG